MIKNRLFIGLLLLSLLLGVTSSGVQAAKSGSFAGGDGTKENPFFIATTEQLDQIRYHLDEHFVLAADLEFQEGEFAANGLLGWDGQGWLPIGTEREPFTGTFDGAGHTISGLWMDVRQEELRSEGDFVYAGLFGYNQGLVQNVNLNGSFLAGESTDLQKNWIVGALVGVNDGGSVLNCKNNCAVSVYSDQGDVLLGGIVGQNRGGTVENCNNAGAISGRKFGGTNSAVGGVAGGNVCGGFVKNCINNGPVSFYDGGVSDFSAIGGIAGSNLNSYITNCQNKGEIFAGVQQPIWAGGNVGKNHAGVIYRCSNWGTVIGREYAGGIVAWSQNHGSILDCYNFGIVQSYEMKNGHGSTSGGIAGYVDGRCEISRCGNSGPIYAEEDAGGIVGKLNESTVARCWNTGSCESAANVAGIATYNGGQVRECYSSGLLKPAVDMPNYAGGIVGWNYGDIEACYHVGTIEKWGIFYMAGGIVALTENGTIQNCYYMDDIQNTWEDAGTYCTKEQMCRQDTYQGLDFEDVWQIADGNYPYPQLLDNWMEGECPVSRDPIEMPQVRNPFQDVSAERFFSDAVLWAVENGVTSGVDCERFAPDAVCTRGQVVTFLWRAMGCPEPEHVESNFIDLNSNRFYYKAVLWAAEQGIAQGVDETRFAPDARVTRGQFVTFLWRAVGEPSSAGENPFTDVSSDRFYYWPILWASENEITSGVSEMWFAPERGCTRGQVVTFLYRCLAGA